MPADGGSPVHLRHCGMAHGANLLHLPCRPPSRFLCPLAAQVCWPRPSHIQPGGSALLWRPPCDQLGNALPWSDSSSEIGSSQLAHVVQVHQWWAAEWCRMATSSQRSAQGTLLVISKTYCRFCHGLIVRLDHGIDCKQSHEPYRHSKFGGILSKQWWTR